MSALPRSPIIPSSPSGKVSNNFQDYPEMMALVKQEVEDLRKRQDQLLEELKVALLPQDPSSEKNAIVEIRAGTGGEEAALFAADLYRMYSRYAQVKGWKVEMIDASHSDRGGFKEIIFEVSGKNAFGRLKHERGVHRVQRVPVTEAGGRVHTSTATVAVLPEAEEVEINVKQEELRIDIFHSGGPGGQNVNKVATAVRIVHIPTGMMVVSQENRSQLQNRVKAMALLRSRLLDIEQRKQQEEISRDRRAQVAPRCGRGNIFHMAPFVFVARGNSVTLVNSPWWDGLGNFDSAADGKTAAWLTTLVNTYPDMSNLTLCALNHAMTIAETDLRIPPFSGTYSQTTDAPPSGMYCTVLSSETYNQFTFDPYLQANKNCALDVVNNSFKGSLFGRITCKLEDLPLMMTAAGAFNAPEIRVEGGDAYNEGDTVSNPNYTDLSVSPYASWIQPILNNKGAS